MDKKIIIVVIIIVVLVILMALPQTSLFPQIRDSDGDGRADDEDAFPNDASEWRDSDDDEVGDNADFYDNGDGAVKITIIYFEMISDVSECDPYFKIILDPDVPDFPDFQWQSPVYEDRTQLTNPFGAYLVYNIPDDTPSITLQIAARDDNGDTFTTIDIGPTHPYYITVYSPFSEDHSDVGTSSLNPDARLDWKIEVIAAG